MTECPSDLQVSASPNDTPPKITVRIKRVVAWIPYTLNPIPFTVYERKGIN